MAVRATMAALIASVRILINDPSGGSELWPDQTIQDVLDEARVDVFNEPLIPKPTYTGATINFLDYWAQLGGWEDGYTLKQFLITVVTPSTLEPIAGHWQFASSTLPPVYITGSLHDRYRAAADLLERQAAMWVLRYDIAVDGQSLHRSQAAQMLTKLAATYRAKQRPQALSLFRSDTRTQSALASVGLGPTQLDYMGDGNKGGN